MTCLDSRLNIDFVWKANPSADVLDGCMFQLQHLDFVYSGRACFYTSLQLDLGLMDPLSCQFFIKCLQDYSNGSSHYQIPIQVVEKYDFYQVSICSYYALQKITRKPDKYFLFWNRDGVIPFLRKTREGSWSCIISLKDRRLIDPSLSNSYKSYCFRVKECLEKKMSVRDALKKNVETYNGLPIQKKANDDSHKRCLTARESE